MITIKDVAKEAGVSVSTVSYVLNDDPRISPETRQHVQKSIEKLGYCGRAGKKRPQRASSISSEPNIVLYLHSVFGPVYSALISSMKRIFDLNGYHLYIHMNDELVQNTWADGYIILNSQITDSEIQSLSDQNIPCVLLDRATSFPHLQHVLIDNESGEYQLTLKLLKKDCRRFAFVGGIAQSYDSQKRFLGYQRALEEYGLNADDMIFIRGDYSYNSGVNAIKYLLSKEELPHAIVCANDEMAQGVLSILNQSHIPSHPLPVVTGFDGFEITDQNASFPTVAVDYDSWGSIAAYSIIEKIKNTGPVTETVFIPTTVYGI